MKTAFLFPGQGSQKAGMAKGFYDSVPSVKALMDKAGPELLKLIFEGPDEALKQTENTQPALFVAETAAMIALKSKGIVPEGVAGHSLGEYPALFAAGAFGFDEGLRVVRARGEALRDASKSVPGTMAAILGLARDKVEDVCKQASAKGVCEPVNFNCPGQIVIAGAQDALTEACALAKAAGAKRAMVLPVSGPFHSSLMKPAAQKMEPVIRSAQFSDAVVPVYQNADASPNTANDKIKSNLILQIDHPVKWEDSIRRMIADGFGIFVEFGPGTVLSGMMRNIDPNVKVVGVSDPATLDKAMQDIAAVKGT